jgi:predicted nucleic-acid-binding Zn-ribbon protein
VANLWEYAVPRTTIERYFMKCVNCGSTNITDALAVEDDGAYPAGNHKVTTGHGRSRMSKKSDTRLAARVCTDCGFTALFAEDPSALSD